MYFVQTDFENRVMAYTEADENPDESLWQESPWDVPPADFDDWLYVDGQLVHSPRDLPPVPYTAQEVLTAMFSESPEMMDSLPDSALEHMAAYMPEWEAGKSYQVGDKVQHGERPYRCLQAHTSQDEWNPADAVSLWARILAGGDTIPVWEQPESTNPYMKGDKVHFPTASDPVYVSDIDYNVYAPNVYGWSLEGGE